MTDPIREQQAPIDAATARAQAETPTDAPAHDESWLVTCKSCGATFDVRARDVTSDDGTLCPHCGHPTDSDEGTGHADWKQAYPPRHRDNPDDLPTMRS